MTKRLDTDELREHGFDEDSIAGSESVSLNDGAENSLRR